jgi:uncharacterized protein (TIGR03067 family)
MKASLLLLLTAVPLLGADAAKEAVKKDLDKLQGTWVPVSLKYNGEELGNVKFKMVFKGDQATVEGNDEIRKEYAKITFKLDTETNPRCVDLIVTAGVQKDVVMEGIYEVKDGEIKMCVKVFGKDRPTEFASPEGSSIVLVVLKRE